ncbi:arginine-tRNA-protein transferase [Crepidotus variabilis]|uniref:Arginyl-tRNA--protein transferase 1 n=1 Tax=Crepidotus variabilis TaxID=179855 RepID=A0A9P6JVT1_9AGAR|nr:arginine-tRNA-protein transferase [Crepidotus variabilis]
MEDINFRNIVYPGSAGPSTCGYCSPPGQRSKQATNYHSATLDALKLTPSAYQKMIDRGWRRSGTYCYKSDLKQSCCPQYTIKLDALEFQATRSHRQLLNRFNRFILHGEPDNSLETSENSNVGRTNGKKNKGSSPPKLPPFTTLADSVHLAEKLVLGPKSSVHTFEITLEPSSYTPEKFSLFKKYQADIHNDIKESADGFQRFLVETPLEPEPIPYPDRRPETLPENYGSYHQLYKLDGQLIAMAVLDILPKCVSSVYFIYDKTWERFSLGKLSALREVSLAREIRDAGVENMEALYMGFYIYSCQKMRYKGEYSPSYLVDPETYEWFPMSICIPLLEKHRYACFSNPSHSITGEADPGATNSRVEVSPESELFDGIQVLSHDTSGQIVATSIHNTRYLSYLQVRREMETCIRGLGTELSKDIFFTL